MTLQELDPYDLRGSYEEMFMIYAKQGKEEEAFNSLKKSWAIHNNMEGQVNLEIFKKVLGFIGWLVGKIRLGGIISA